MHKIDLRSDTVTWPTDEMREAMFRAEVGDDVYGDDPTVNKLEEYAAAIVGKEAALFVPSGTFGNQLALFSHCQRGNEVILGNDCHIVQHEVGAASVIAGVQLRTLTSNKGVLDPLQIEKTIRGEDLHFPATGLVCMENAHSNGRVIPLDNMSAIYDVAHSHNIPVHLDGARLFNAAAYLKADAREITRYCDSVMLCLSKGLCAPVGSMLAGTREFITVARKKRKLMGGGLRQAGILAAAGLIALDKMRLRVGEDHENALLLARELAQIPGVEVNIDDIHINMVYFELSIPIDDEYLVEEMHKQNILINPIENGVYRFVTHYWVTPADIERVAVAMKNILSARTA
jgi:threonine aldolase